jgi:hypothetical protein
VPSLYVLVCRLLELVVLIARGDRAKELEILVLRHQVSILRRQARQPRFEPHDRLLLAVLSRKLPRGSWDAWGAEIRSRCKSMTLRRRPNLCTPRAPADMRA